MSIPDGEAAPTGSFDLRSALRDAVVVIGTFVVLGALAAVVWHGVVHLPTFERTSDGAVMNQSQLAGLISIDGWYFVISVPPALVAGGVLMHLRRREPRLTVLLILAGAALAAWLMGLVGGWLGPADPSQVLRHLSAGGHAPVQLHLQATGVEFAWPVAALLAALFVLLGRAADSHSRHQRRERQEPAPTVSGD